MRVRPAYFAVGVTLVCGSGWLLAQSDPFHETRRGARAWFHFFRGLALLAIAECRRR